MHRLAVGSKSDSWANRSGIPVFLDRSWPGAAESHGTNAKPTQRCRNSASLRGRFADKSAMLSSIKFSRTRELIEGLQALNSRKNHVNLLHFCCSALQVVDYQWSG
jgi:hypothetical protein